MRLFKLQYKKTRFFVKNEGFFKQSIFLSGMVIRDGIRSDALKILILLSPFPFEIYYINVKGGLNLAKVEIT